MKKSRCCNAGTTTRLINSTKCYVCLRCGKDYHFVNIKKAKYEKTKTTFFGTILIMMLPLAVVRDILSTYYKKYKNAYILVVIAVLVQAVAYSMTVLWGRGGFMWLSDSVSYLEMGKNLMLYKDLIVNIDWGVSAWRTPLYPLFVGIFYKIIPSVWFIILAQNVVGVINILLTYKIGKLVFNSKVGFLGALLLIFESSRLILTNQVMSETLFVLLVLLMVYYFAKGIKEGKTSYIVISAVFCGLGALTRIVIQFFPIGVLLFFIIYGITTKKKWLLSAILFVSVFAVTISPWLIRNYIHFKRVELSSASGYVLYSMYGGKVLDYKLGLSDKGLDAKTILDERFLKHFNLKRPTDQRISILGDNWYEPQYQDWFREEGVKIFKDDPLFYIGIQMRKMATFFIESSASRSYGDALLVGLNLPAKIFYPYMYYGGRMLWILYGLLIVSSLIFFPLKKNLWIKIFLICTILYFAMFSGGWAGIGRARQPVNPLIFLFLASAILNYRCKL